MEENSINKPLSKWRKLNDDDKAKYFAVVMKVNEFCQAHDIETKRNTYYRFKLNKKNYLVTHDRFIYQLVNQLKDKIEDESLIVDRVFYASKLRICEIYRNLEAKKNLDERGRVINK